MTGGTVGENESVAVQLVRMEGKIDRVNDSQRRAENDMVDVKGRLNSHSTRLNALEAKEQQRTGAIATVRAMWALGGAGIAALVAAIARHLGV